MTAMGGNRALPDVGWIAGGLFPMPHIRLQLPRGAGQRIMEFLFEMVFQFVGEILLQACFELLAELGVRSLEDTFRKPRNPVLSTIGFLIWGSIAGAVSLLFFPRSPIAEPMLRQLNLIVTPLAIGIVMTMVGRVRLKKGQSLVRLDQFGYAYTFAFAMALVRFIWAH
jgi:hypothetical protein